MTEKDWIIGALELARIKYPMACIDAWSFRLGVCTQMERELVKLRAKLADAYDDLVPEEAKP